MTYGYFPLDFNDVQMIWWFGPELKNTANYTFSNDKTDVSCISYPNHRPSCSIFLSVFDNLAPGTNWERHSLNIQILHLLQLVNYSIQMSVFGRYLGLYQPADRYQVIGSPMRNTLFGLVLSWCRDKQITPNRRWVSLVCLSHRNQLVFNELIPPSAFVKIIPSLP